MSRSRLVPLSILFALSLATLLSGAGCGEPQPVILGALVPDTGPAKTYGRSVRQGIELAVEEVNKAGGVKGGAQLQLEFRDTQTDPAAAAAALNELADLGAPVVIGPVASNVALGLTDIAERRKVVLVSPAASNPRLSKEGGQWFFRVYPSDVVEGARLADLTAQQTWARVGIVASDTPHGQDIADIFTQRYEAGVREVVFRHDISGLTDEVTEAILADIRKTKPNALFVAAYQDLFADVLEAVDTLDERPAVIGTSAVTIQVIDMAGEAADGIIFPQLYCGRCTDEEHIVEFADAYEQKFGEEADTYAAHAYDAVKVVAEAMKLVTVISANDMLGELTRIKYDGVTGDINFNVTNHDVVKTPSIYAIVDGEIVKFDKFKQTELGQKVLSR